MQIKKMQTEFEEKVNIIRGDRPSDGSCIVWAISAHNQLRRMVVDHIKNHSDVTSAW
jgi:hypothetical protein